MRAVNGREAVELCKTNDNINLVLMDIKMPEMNGYEAREEIRRFKPGLPVIAQTAYALPADVERLKKSFFRLHYQTNKPAFADGKNYICMEQS
jgi:CheY-like chemotaxis protein